MEKLPFTSNEKVRYIGYWRAEEEITDEIIAIYDKNDRESFERSGKFTVLELTATEIVAKDNKTGEVFRRDRLGDGMSIHKFAEQGIGHLPFPIENSSNKTREETEEWLERLKQLEEYTDHEVYLGYSYCRLCYKHKDVEFENGSVEYYELSWTEPPFMYIWPEGYKHYVDKHNIEIPEDFWEFVWNYCENHNKLVEKNRKKSSGTK